MQQPFLVQANLLQLMSEFLQIIMHLLSPQLLTHKLLKHTDLATLKFRYLAFIHRLQKTRMYDANGGINTEKTSFGFQGYH